MAVSKCEVCGNNSFREFLLITKTGERMTRCTVTYMKQLDSNHAPQMVVCGKIFNQNGSQPDPGEFIVWKDGDGKDVKPQTAKTLAFI